MKTKVIPIGNSRGVILPKSVIDSLGLRSGDQLLISVASHPPRLTISPVEAEAESLGLTPDVRKDVAEFLDIYESLLGGL